MKKFRANYGTRIEELEVVKETEKTIVYIDMFGKEQRDYKVSSWNTWHDSKTEALNFLVNKKQKEIEHLYSQIKYKEEELENIIKL